MAHNNRSLDQLNRLKATAYSHMREIHDHSKISHSTECLTPKRAETGSIRFKTSVSKEVSGIVGELHDSDTELMIHIEEVNTRFNRVRPLKVQDNGYHSLVLGLPNSGNSRREANRKGLRTFQFKPVPELFNSCSAVL